MSSISIARAMVELKTLDSRINKITDFTAWIVCKTKSKNTNLVEEEFRKSTLSEYQSLNDLITRRDKLKNAIIKSNSLTMVNIGGKKLSVSEAIEFKKTIQYKKNILQKLKQQKQQATIEVELHKQRVQNKIDINIQQICSKESKSDENFIKSIIESSNKNDPIDLFDPLNLEKEIKDLETSIEDFEANIDYVLSESNALTCITV